MKNSRLRIKLCALNFFLVFTAACSLNAIAQEMSKHKFDNARAKKVMDSISGNNILPSFVVMGVDKSNIIFHYEKGKEVAGKNTPVNLNSIFRIYSMTKAITSVAAMQLVEQGKVTLDEPLGKWLPEMMEIPIISEDGHLVKSDKPITLRQLLTHTAGFAYSFNHRKLINFKVPPDWKYKDFPRVNEPGEQFWYGTNTLWAGRLIEKISGKDLETYIRENLTDPLKMKRTFYTVPDSLTDYVVSIYGLNKGVFIENSTERLNPERIKPSEFQGDGGMFSTPNDYARFIRCILNEGELDGKRILSRETVRLLFKNQLDEKWTKFELFPAYQSFADTAQTFCGISKHGLAWAVGPLGETNPHYPGTAYWAGAANTFFSINVKNGRAVLFFSNTFPFGNRWCESVFYRTEELLYK
jgi:CubicO group peptidase (beta-lactamase class C family)